MKVPWLLTYSLLLVIYYDNRAIG